MKAYFFEVNRGFFFLDKKDLLWLYIALQLSLMGNSVAHSQAICLTLSYNHNFLYCKTWKLCFLGAVWFYLF